MVVLDILQCHQPMSNGGVEILPMCSLDMAALGVVFESGEGAGLHAGSPNTVVVVLVRSEDGVWLLTSLTWFMEVKLDLRCTSAAPM
jgi:hypothetical protein